MLSVKYHDDSVLQYFVSGIDVVFGPGFVVLFEKLQDVEDTAFADRLLVDGQFVAMYLVEDGRLRCLRIWRWSMVLRLSAFLRTMAVWMGGTV